MCYLCLSYNICLEYRNHCLYERPYDELIEKNSYDIMSAKYPFAAADENLETHSITLSK